jgi:hypothetical protein
LIIYHPSHHHDKEYLFAHNLGICGCNDVCSILAYNDFDFDSLKEKQFTRRRMRKSNNDPHLRFNTIAANSHAMRAKIFEMFTIAK